MRRPKRAAPISVVLGATVALTGTSVLGAEAEAPSIVVPDELVVTPSQPEGPFYPLERPDDHDADLVNVAGQDRPAAGVPLRLDGLVLTADGQPVEGAVVEIWQTDDAGIYLHPGDPGVAARDEAFAGYGESVADADGAWSFLTILPEVYGSRPRHIHAKVVLEDETLLTTQIYFGGGDIPADGAVALTGGDADALIVEATEHLAEDGSRELRAQHLLVLADLDRP